MHWYLLVLIFLCDEIHLKAAVPYGRDVQRLEKRAAISSATTQHQFQQEVLKAHNSFRALHCAPPLTLSDTISQSAQSYAANLAQISTLVHSNSKDLGENLYMIGSSASIKTMNGTEATNAWYDEVKNYNFGMPQFSTTTGHFTQLVWKNTTKIGVGFALSADGHSAYVVAQYSPPGNYQGQFGTNVLPQGQC